MNSPSPSFAGRGIAAAIILSALLLMLSPAVLAQASPKPADQPSKPANLEPLKLNPEPAPASSTTAEKAAAPNPAVVVPQSINKAAVTGIVTDMSGDRKVDDARVVLTKIGEEHRRFQTETKADGVYVFNNIEPGQWSLTTSAKEMLSHTTNVMLEAGQTKSIPIHLEDAEPVDV